VPAPEHPDQLRARARSLRSLATELEQTPALSLQRDAGPATWHGPRAEACVRTLVALQHPVHEAAEDLRWLAHRLEVRAAELDAAHARAAGW
jgi:hypothetical protein